MLRAVSLECIRDDRSLFRELNFAVSDGELLAIEGRNGSGKTSLLRILCGIRLPDDGDVEWNGSSIAALGPGYHENVAWVAHTDGVKLDLTPLENLTFAGALGALRDDIDLEQVLDRVGLFALEEVPTRVLSAGQKRRLALSRLLITTAKLWILDEPLSSLDRAGIALFEQLLLEHLQSGGMAIMTTHHRLSLPDERMRRIDLSQS